MAQHAVNPGDRDRGAEVVPIGRRVDDDVVPWHWNVRRDRVTYARALVDAGHVGTDTESSGDAIQRIHPSDRDVVARAFEAALGGAGAFRARYRVIGADGRLRYVENRVEVLVGDDGVAEHVIGAMRSRVAPEPGAAPRDAAADAATGDAAFLDGVLDNLADGVLACSRTGVPIVVNRAARALFETATGSSWNDHAGRDWLVSLVSASSVEGGVRPWRGPLELALAGTAVHDARVSVRTAAGSDLHLRLNVQPIGESVAVGVIVVTIRDVTTERAAQALLDADAAHHPATRLPNRAATLAYAARAIAEVGDEPAALLVLEVRGLEAVVERYGDALGDGVVRATARAIADELAPRDFLGHVAPGEFAVVVTDRAAERADELASRLSRALAADALVHTAPDEPDLVVSVRLGVARSTPDSTPRTLLHQAELAARDTRHRGPVVTYEAPEAEGARALEHAIAAGELVLNYQPKVDVASSRIVGVEALVRWERPGHGMVPPAEFIPLAESTGLIVGLGEWVLRTACRDARTWTAEVPEHPPLRMCVNVSPHQLDDENVASVVADALASTGLDPELLTLEITESAVMRDVDRAIETLRDLRRIGVAISVDDFGTGYSSLSYLRRLPIDELKIDRSFVAGLGATGAERALVGGIVSLAHALELTVVAEGVETDEQMETLATVGCDVAQGFLLHRPMPAADVAAVLRSDVERRAVARASGGLRDDTVVVADDADDVRLLARMSLATSGFEVHDVDNGAAVLELVRATRSGVVVLDVQMPGADGFALCRALRADPATADCTIVMLTATDAAADKVNAFSAGADEYIVKPFSPRDLVGRLRAAQRRRRAAGGT